MFRKLQLFTSMMLVSFLVSGCFSIRRVDFASIQTQIADIIDSCNSVTMQGDGTALAPFIICSQAQFAALNSSTVGQYYALGRDITFDSTATPITILFRANLDGNHHTLSSFQSVGVGGLFNRLHTGSTVQNLTLSNFKVSSGNALYAGALAGRANTATITNVIVKDSVITGGKMVGGLIGYDHSSVLTGIEVHDTAVSAQEDTGLLIGKCDGATSITQAVIQGQVAGSHNIGGIVGNAVGLTVTQAAVFSSITNTQDDNFEWTAGWPNYSTNIGGFFGYVETSNISESYFVGDIMDSVDGLQAGMGTNYVGSFAGEAMNSSVWNSYFAPNKIIDAIGNSYEIHGFLGLDDGGNSIGSNIYYAHVTDPALENWSVWGYDDLTMMDQSNFPFDFSDLISDPFNPYVGVWQMSAASHFQFPILSIQSQTQPFGAVEYRSTPTGALYITEAGGTANGYTFDEIAKGVTAYTFLTLHNSTGFGIDLNAMTTGGIREAFHVVTSGVNAGTCSALTTLADGSDCTIGVEYAPIHTAVLHETNRDVLRVRYTIDGVATTYVHPLEGQSVMLDPVFTFNPAVAFGNLIFPASPTLPLNIDNTGINPGTILSITPSDPAYTITPNTCNVGAILNNGGWCNLTITFTPTTIRSYAANIVVVYEDAAHTQYTLTVPVTGALIEHPFNDDPAMVCQTADGSAAHPFCVYDRAELDAVANYGGSNFIQTADIDMGGASQPKTSNIGLMPGRYYDGQNHIISNMYSEKNALFVVLDTGATLKNLTFDSPVVKRPDNNDFVGAAVGYNSGGIIDHVSIIGNGSVSFNNARPYVDQKPTGGLVGWSINGTITHCDVQLASVTGEEAVGGLVGYLQGGTVEYSTVSAVVTGSGRFVGGFVGVNGWSGHINYSSSASTVITTKAHITQGGFTSSYYSGGFAGYLGSNSTILGSYSTGDVTSADGEAGGFIGRVDPASSVDTCYSSGNVSSVQNSVGGFAGKNVGTVANSFSKGGVSGANKVGGFVGWNEGTILKTMSLVGTINQVIASGSEAGGFVGANTNGSITNSFNAIRSVSGTGNVGGFVGTNTATIANAYTLADTVPASHGFVGSNSGTITNSYINADGTTDVTSTAIASASMNVQGNWAFDFATPIWKMPSSNTGAHVLSPVPAWSCNLTGTGITCP